MDFARLGIDVDFTKLKAATNEMNRFAGSSKTAKTAADQVTASLGTASGRARTFTTQTAKVNQHLGNMSAQFFDIGVMLAAGQSPFQLGVQQGTQLVQVMNQMGGGKAAIQGLVASFKMLGKSLPTIAFVALGAAAVQWLTGIGKETEKVSNLMSDAESAVDGFKSAMDDVGLSFSEMVKKFGTGSSDMRSFISELAAIEKVKAIDKIEELGEAMAEFFKGIKGGPTLMANFFGEGSLKLLNRDFNDMLNTFGSAVDTLQNGHSVAEKLAAALDMRDIMLENIGAYEQMNENQREFYDILMGSIQRLQTLADVEDEVKSAVEGTVAAQVKSFAYYAKFRKEQNAAAQEAREMVKAYQDQATIQQLINQYGEDSKRVSAERRVQYEAAQQALIGEMNISDALKQRLLDAAMQAWDLENASGQAANRLSVASAMAASLAANASAAAAAMRGFVSGVEGQIATLQYQTDALEAGFDASVGNILQKRDALTKSMAEMGVSVDQIAAAHNKGTELANQYQEALDRNREAVKRYAKAGGGGADALKKFNGELESVVSRLDPSYKAALQYEKSVTVLAKALEKGILTQAEFNKYVALAKKEMDEAGNSAKNYGGDLASSLVNNLSGDGGIKGFWNDFKSMGVSSFTDILSTSFAPGGGGFTAVFQGLSTAWQGATSALATGGLAGIFGAVSSAMPIIGAVIAGFQLLKGLVQKETIGAGIGGSIGMNSSGYNYEKIRTKYLWGLFSRTSIEKEDDDKITNLLKKQSNAVRKSVSRMVSSLGEEISGFNKVIHQFQFDARDMSQKEIRARLRKEFDQYANQLAKIGLRTHDVRMRGESYIDALTRMAEGLPGVNSAMRLLGRNLFEVSYIGADAASRLAELMGGVEDFMDATQSYFSNFYTTNEQYTLMVNYLTEALSNLGMVMPNTREEFRALVEAQDLMTKQGRKNYAALMAMSEQMAGVLPELGAYGTELGLVMELLSGALGEAISDARKFESQLRNLSEGLIDAAYDIRVGALGDQLSQNRFNSLYASAMSGNIEAMEKLSGAGSDYARYALSSSATASDYAFASAQIAQKLLKVSDVAITQADLYAVQADQLQYLKDQVDNGTITNEILESVVLSLDGVSDDLMTAMRNVAILLSGDENYVPGFKDGGRHFGGLRVVGESGPELERTGPSSVLSNNELGERLRDFSRMYKEMREMREEQKQLNVRMSADSTKLRKIFQKWDQEGMPDVRETV